MVKLNLKHTIEIEEPRDEMYFSSTSLAYSSEDILRSNKQPTSLKQIDKPKDMTP